MNFVSLSFLLFLFVAAVCYYVMPKITRPFWMLACSYTFYLYDPENAPFVALLLGMTAATYLLGLLIQICPVKPVRIAAVAAAVLGCSSVLGWGLYLHTAIKPTALAGLMVPLGSSYFTFAALGYIIDVYRGKTRAERNPLYYALFVSFFPCIVTGPIERAGNLLPQFKRKVTFDYNRVSGGMFRILWGCFKKLVIADTIGGIVGTVFGKPAQYSGPILLIACLLFTYQLYCDFSAASDIAIGAAAVFGIEVMENFTRPLAASSYTGLWRRWHISLSSWFRDYLYFPLGGSRKGKLRAHVNQVIVFSVSGLWHGLTPGYLIWGLLNGVFLAVGKETSAVRGRIAARNPLYRLSALKSVIQAVIVYLLFTATLVFFRAASLSDAAVIYGGLWQGWDVVFSQSSRFLSSLSAVGWKDAVPWIILGGAFGVELLEFWRIPVNQLIRRIPFFVRWPLYYALIILIGFYGQFGSSGFIYQQY